VIRGEIEKHLAGRVATARVNGTRLTKPLEYGPHVLWLSMQIQITTVSISLEADIIVPDVISKTVCGINQAGNSTFEMPANRFMHVDSPQDLLKTVNYHWR